MNLEIDQDLFHEKVEEDLFFLNETLQKLQSSLKESPHLIRRAEHLHTLMKTKQQYSDLIEEVLSKKVPFGEHLQDIKERLQVIFTQQRTDITNIHNTLAEETENPQEKEDIISGTEMHFLFTRDEED